MVYANEALAGLSGTKQENLLAVGDIDVLKFVHADDRDAIRDAVEASDLNSTGADEMRFMVADVGSRWLRLPWVSAGWEGVPHRKWPTRISLPRET